MRKIFSIGLPIGAASFCEVSFFMFATLLIGQIGTVDQLAAHQIALNLASTTFMIANGVAQASSIQIAQSKGKNKFEWIRIHAITGYALVLFFMLIVTLMFLAIPEVLISIYSPDTAVLIAAVPLVKIASGFQILDGFQVMGISASKGIQDTRVPFLNTVIAFWLFGMPAAFVFSQSMSAQGVWLGMIVGLGLAALLHAQRLFKVLRRDFPTSADS